MTYSNEDFYKEAFFKSLEILSLTAEVLSMIDLNPKDAPQVYNTPHFKAVQVALAEAHSTLKAVDSLPDDMGLEEEEMQERSDGTPYVSKRVYANAYWKITLQYGEDGHVIERNSKKRH